MAIPLFLAAHPQELTAPVEHYAWMACRFSENALANLPQTLPGGAMVILTDDVSPTRQDPDAVAALMAALNCAAILLDFQRPDCPLTKQIAAAIVKGCACPVGVTEYYAEGLDCPIFLSPIPPDRPPEEYLKPRSGRELWLDLAPSPTRITVTAEGSRCKPLAAIPTPQYPHRDRALCCHYGIETNREAAIFDLWRTKDDLRDLLSAAESFGVTRAVGLYQELGAWQGKL